MTREEAIEVIKDLIDTYVVCHGEEDMVAVSLDNVDVEALDMAIKALEQEPKFIAKSDGTIEQIKNCNNCKYGYLSSICQKPNTEICGNSFSQWKPYKAESDDCISRKEALRIAELGAKEGLLWQQMQLSILPSVQPKPKTDVLDKIRAEIEALEDGISSYHNDRPWIFKDEVLAIIDKYKAESEE